MSERSGDIHLPETLATSIARWPGTTATEWLDALPERMRDAAERWGIAFGPAYEPGGWTSYVAPVALNDGTRAVYKCTIPHPEAVGEAEALMRYKGDGAVRVIASKPDTYELLLERCDPGHSLWSVEDDDERLDIAVGLMKRLWRPVEDGVFTSLAELGATWSGITMRRLMTLEVPWVTGPIERGADLLTTLPASAPESVLLHHDFHPDNVLAAEREPWLAIDPKPNTGDPAFEPIPLLTQLDGESTPAPDLGRVEANINRMAGFTGLSAERIALWTIARTAEWTMWSFERGDVVDASISYTWCRAADTIVGS